MQDLFERNDRQRRVGMLAGLAVASLVLWQTFWGSLLLYPFTVLATWFHEMGHGLAAIVLGGRFERLLIFADGSGLALSSLEQGASGLSRAIISAGGPLGPPVAGALLIMASRRAETTRLALALLGLALLVSTAVWVRSPIGWVVLPLTGVGLFAIAWRASTKVQEFAVQLLGVQACISTYHQTWYLFTPGGMVGGVPQRSDTGAMADVLLLPYWFWAIAITLVILGLLAGSLYFALRR